MSPALTQVAAANAGWVRVALVADTHGFLDPRIAALVNDCDTVLHAGDIGSADVLAQLQPRGGRVYAVLGNNDTARKWPENQRDLLERIPHELRLALPGGELVLLHGHRLTAARRHQRLRQRYPRARAICYGHSHLLADDRSELPWVLNPGAAGRARTYGGPSCLVLMASEQGWQLQQYRFEPRSPARRRQTPSVARARPA
jgi:putative phosphoesterase